MSTRPVESRARKGWGFIRNFCMVFAVTAFCVACSSTTNDKPWSSWGAGSLEANTGRGYTGGTRPVGLSGHGAPADDQSIYYHGSGEMVGRGTDAPLDGDFLTGPPATVNLVNASIELPPRR